MPDFGYSFFQQGLVQGYGGLGGYGGSGFGAWGGGLMPADPATADKAERGKPQQGLAESAATIAVTDPRDYANGYGGSYAFGGPGGYLQAPLGNPWLYLQLISDPVLAAARAYALNAILGGTWRLVAREGTPQAWQDRVKDATKPFLDSYRTDAVWGVDMGWAGWQIDWERVGGNYHLGQMNACRQEASFVLYDPNNARYRGIRFNAGQDVYGHRAFIYTYDRRGQHWTGRSRVENCIQAVWNWRDANDNTSRLAKKESGIVVGIGVPPGMTKDPATGQMVSRELLAQAFGQTITSGAGYYTYPTLAGMDEASIKRLMNDPAAFAKVLELSLWQVRLTDLGEHGPAITALTADKRYLDELKCLGYYVPPEAVLHNANGNRAKAAQMSGNAALMNGPVNIGVCSAFNAGPVNSLLQLSFGPQAVSSVWWEPEPLSDDQPTVDAAVMQAFLAAPPGSDQIAYLSRNFDIPAIFERNGIAKLPNPLSDKDMGDLLTTQKQNQQKSDAAGQKAQQTNGNGNANGGGRAASIPIAKGPATGRMSD